MKKPSSFLPLGLALVLGVSATACAPTMSRQGYLAIEADPAKDIKVGEDTQTSVRTRFGSPSQVATYAPNIWYYISQTSMRMTYKPSSVTTRSVTIVEFDPDTQTVKDVRNLSLEDGKRFALNPNETPTRGRELTALEQILGNVGRQTIVNEEDQLGGQRRRE